MDRFDGKQIVVETSHHRISLAQGPHHNAAVRLVQLSGTRWNEESVPIEAL
jgi:hypothetical protein